MAHNALEQQERLIADIKHAGFYPELMLEAVNNALAGLEPQAHFVQHETHFSRNYLHRHISVFVLCNSVLVLAHLDDQNLEEGGSDNAVHVSVEAVNLRALRAVTVSYGYDQPQNYRPGTTPSEISFQVAWSGSMHLDITPASCQDPACTADHGYCGSASRDDIAVRVSATADGPEAVAQAHQFARALHRAHMLAG